MSDIIIREMKIEDIKQVVDIENLSFPTPWSPYAFSCELLDNNFANYLVLTPGQDEKKILGYGGMWVILDEAHITNIAIHPEYRGKGLGEILLTELIKLALQKGAIKMTLEVRVSNTRAQGLYAKMGFKESGIRKGYYTDTKEDALIMWKKLIKE